jgi:hypothetical protein
VQGRFDRFELGQDIHTVALIFNHFLDALDLSFDPVQTGQLIIVLGMHGNSLFSFVMIKYYTLVGYLSRWTSPLMATEAGCRPTIFS